MLTGIISTRVPEVNPEFPCVCRDCGNVMSALEQRLTHGTLTLITCWTPACPLSTVTLSVEQYNGLNESQLESYRAMNRARAQGLHVVAVGEV